MPRPGRIPPLVSLLVGFIVYLAGTRPCPAAEPARDVVDASTLHGKVMAGYQGWFRCPGDAAGMG